MVLTVDLEYWDGRLGADTVGVADNGPVEHAIANDQDVGPSESQNTIDERSMVHGPGDSPLAGPGRCKPTQDDPNTATGGCQRGDDEPRSRGC